MHRGGCVLKFCLDAKKNQTPTLLKPLKIARSSDYTLFLKVAVAEKSRQAIISPENINLQKKKNVAEWTYLLFLFSLFPPEE